MWRLVLLLAACGQASEPPAGLDLGAARAAVERQRATLQACNASGTTATLRLRLVVTPSGQVLEAEAIGAARIAPCVERSVQGWTFPSAEGETEIELPIAFTASGDMDWEPEANR